MRVIITGGTGLIGHRLSYWMVREGHDVIVLSRNSQAKRMPPNVQGARWDAYSSFGWGHLIEENSVIVNLAGENPTNWRWTSRHKRRVMASRIDATEAIHEAVERAQRKPALLVQASAVGYYGDRGAETITETSPMGEGFWPDLCEEWEATAKEIPIRSVILRIGVVLSRDGGYLAAMHKIARLLARKLGTGEQWIPWVHVDDVCFAISHLIKQQTSIGVYNVTAPEPVTNTDFMKTLSHTISAPRLYNVPTWSMNLLAGEQALTVLDSQRVLPVRLQEAGFRFKYPTINVALEHLLGSHYEGRRNN
ncbi:MAG: TIGR01777 family protein [Chloroflexi bacterium]|nr:TIGR01777 family protein [Chloroflexota bacterium]